MTEENKKAVAAEEKKETPTTKEKKESSFKSKLGFLLIIVAIVFIVILLYRHFDNMAVLRNCQDIEQQLSASSEIQEANATCTCQPGRLYRKIINASDKLKNNAELRYVVICQSHNETRLYPIWKSH